MHVCVRVCGYVFHEVDIYIFMYCLFGGGVEGAR